MAKNTLLAAALEYSNMGWKVFPLHNIMPDGSCSCGKTECASPGKHPRYHPEDIPNGLYSASDDPDIITEWWLRWPDANIGLRTGRESGVIVVDLDEKEEYSGHDSLKLLEEKYGKLPPTRSSTTGSEGTHKFLVYPKNFDGEVSNTISKIAPGIDVRGDRGYVVVPPSNHKSGRTYCWDNPDAPMGDTPAWLLELNQKKEISISIEELRAKAKEIPEGQRNKTLFRMACNYRGKGLSDDEIIPLLKDINNKYCKPPVSDEELEKLVTHVAEDYATNLEKQQAGLQAGMTQEIVAEDMNWTELGNAYRFAVANSTDMRFCYTKKLWYIYDAYRWEEHHGGEPERRAKAVIRAMKREMEEMEEGSTKNKYSKFIKSSESVRELSNMVTGARSELEIKIEDLDIDPYDINLLNGTLNLKDFVLRPHNPTDHLSYLAPVNYNPGAQCPNWHHHLMSIFENDEQTMESFQILCGYSLFDLNPDQVMFIAYGKGKNGKSTTLQVLTAILGDYAASTPTETVMPRQRGSATNDIARLYKKRMVTAVEPTAGARLSEAFVKNVTGGDPIQARFLYQEFFEFVPHWKLWMATNYRPVIQDSDEAIWRRIILIPFEHVFEAGERKMNMTEILMGEKEGIFAWIVEGYKKYIKNGGLQLSKKIKDATKEYRGEMDIFFAFIDECCDLKIGEWVDRKDLHNVYLQWCTSNGEERMSQAKFSRMVHDRLSISPDTMGGKRVWKGIKIKSTYDVREKAKDAINKAKEQQPQIEGY